MVPLKDIPEMCDEYNPKSKFAQECCKDTFCNTKENFTLSIAGEEDRSVTKTKNKNPL